MLPNGWILDEGGGLYDVDPAGPINVTDLLYRLVVEEKHPLLFFYRRPSGAESISDIELAEPNVVFARGPDALTLHDVVHKKVIDRVGHPRVAHTATYSVERVSAVRGFVVLLMHGFDPDEENGRAFKRSQEKLAWQTFLRSAVAGSPNVRLALFSQTLEGDVLDAIAVSDGPGNRIVSNAYAKWSDKRLGLSAGKKGRTVATRKKTAHSTKKAKNAKGSTAAILAKQEVFMLPKGLTRAEAWAAARKRRWKHDHRGFTYDSSTGRAVLT